MSIIADLGNKGSIKSKYIELKTKKNEDSVLYSPQYEKIPASEKQTPEYCSKVTQNAFSGLMRNRHSIPLNDYGKMAVLRNYLTGNQSESYYLNLLNSSDPDFNSPATGGALNSSTSKEFKMKGYEHLDTQIVSSMPSIRQAIQGLFSKYDEYCFVNTIDEDSGRLEEEAVADAFADIQLQPFAQDVQNKYGVPLSAELKFPADTSLEELQIYREMGGFKAKWAEGIEQCVFHTMKKSDWNDVIKKKYIDDMLAFNIIFGRSVYDEATGAERMEYCDPENATIQYSTDRLFADAEFFGYFTLEKLGKLVEKGFSSDKLKQAARTYGGMFSNPQYTTTENSIYNTPTKILNDKILDFRVPVFHYYWLDVDVKRTLKIKNGYRDKNVNIGLDEEIRPVSEYRAKKGVSQEERQTRIRRYYQCSWIVDTDMVYDWGLCKNQNRKNKKEPYAPFFAYKEIKTNKNEAFGSLVEKAMPFLNRQQILWLKYQDALMKAHAGGYLINMRLLENLEIGGKAIDPLEAFEMFWKYGRGLYRDTALGDDYAGGDTRPYNQVEGNYGTLLPVLTAEMEWIKQQIREYTGIDPTTVGIAPTGDTATGINLASQGTNNILKPIQTGIFGVKSAAANYMARKIQFLCRYDSKSYKYYSRIAGEDVTSILKEMHRSGLDYGMYMEAKPDGEEIQSIIEAANAAMSVGRDGQSQIDLSHWMYLKERIMNGGSFKKLRRDIAFMINKKQKLDQKMTQQNIDAQEEKHQKTAQVVAELKQKESQMEQQAAFVLQDKKTKDQMMLNEQEAELELKNAIALKALEYDEGKSEV